MFERRRLPVIGTQAAVIGIVPLAFLLTLLAFALAVQQSNGAIAAQSQRSAQTIAEANRQEEELNAASRDALTYRANHSPAVRARFESTTADLIASRGTIAALVRGEPARFGNPQRFASDIQEGVQILRRYVALIGSRDKKGMRNLETSPEVRRLNANIAPDLAAFTAAQRRITTQRLAQLHAQQSRYTIGMLSVCGIGIIATVLVLLAFGIRIARRLSRLALNARRAAIGEAPIAIGGNDEIAQLDRVYHHLLGRIRQEHDRATTLQHVLLPQTIPALPGLRVDVSYAAATEGPGVGGDWYDVFRLSEHRIGISIGDVAGHGLSAAAKMAHARHVIRTVAYLEDDPSAVMRRVNQILCRNENAMLATALFAELDLLDGTLRYCLAGHPPPMLVRSGGAVQELPGRGFLLGVDPRSTFATESTSVEIGSALVLYTDGVVERYGEYDRGIAHLKSAIEDEYRNGAGNIALAIQNRLSADRAQRDDSAVLFLGVTALGEAAVHGERVTWDLDATVEQSARRVKRAILWHLGELAVEGSDLSLCETIVSEMLGNVARHTPGPATVSLLWKGPTATVEVCDQGEPFEPPSGAMTDLLAESGRGILLVRAISPHFAVTWTGRGNCVSAVLPVTIGHRHALPAARDT